MHSTAPLNFSFRSLSIRFFHIIFTSQLAVYPFYMLFFTVIYISQIIFPVCPHSFGRSMVMSTFVRSSVVVSSLNDVASIPCKRVDCFQLFCQQVIVFVFLITKIQYIQMIGVSLFFNAFIFDPFVGSLNKFMINTCG